jgi:hypothetical protein
MLFTDKKFVGDNVLEEIKQITETGGEIDQLIQKLKSSIL